MSFFRRRAIGLKKDADGAVGILRELSKHRAWRRLRPASRPYRQAGNSLHTAGNDHRPPEWSRHGLWSGSGLARGQEYAALAREQRNDSGGGNLGRYSQARVSSGPTSNSDALRISATLAGLACLALMTLPTAEAAERWFLMSRHGDCAQVGVLKRKVPDLGEIGDQLVFDLLGGRHFFLANSCS